MTGNRVGVIKVACFPIRRTQFFNALPAGWPVSSANPQQPKRTSFLPVRACLFSPKLLGLEHLWKCSRDDQRGFDSRDLRPPPFMEAAGWKDVAFDNWCAFVCDIVPAFGCIGV